MNIRVFANHKIFAVLKTTWPLLAFLLLLLVFYLPLLKGKIPLSADIITTKFYPINATSIASDQAPHNELTTDPVRQLYPWRHLAISQLKSGHIPWWNPYNLSATPLLANFQSAVFYPGNLIFWLTDFATGWTLLIVSQQLLGGLFLYLYLRHHQLSQFASIFGAITWVFSGFFIGWLEWNTLVHVALWTPLILLSFDHLLSINAPGRKSTGRQRVVWLSILSFSLLAQFFAGSPAPWLYLSFFQLGYLITIYHRQLFTRKILPVIFAYLICALLAAPQFIATWQFATLSNRTADIGNPLTDPTWFLPLPHLIQLIVPDFFGNPVDYNYWGVFNYTEFVSYIGIIPAFFVLYLLSNKKLNKLQFFFTSVVCVSLLMAIKNPISELPVRLGLPLLNTSNASRWLVVTDLSLSLLAAFGLDQLLTKPNRHSAKLCLIVLSIIMGVLWASTFIPSIATSSRNVARSGLVFPSIELIALGLLDVPLFYPHRLRQHFPSLHWLSRSPVIPSAIVITASLTALLFAQKYTTFSSRSDLYPPSRITTYLKQQPGYFRYLALDKNIMPTAINIEYNLYTVEGYDSLYIASYGQLLSFSEDNKIPANPVFHRQPSLQSYQSPITNLLGVKYLMSFDSLPDDHLTLIMQEGFVNLYQNNLVFPRAFVAPSTDIPHIAKVQAASIITYQPNYIKITTTHANSGYLVLSDSYYPGWQATLDGRPVTITNWNGLRATIVPEGDHELIYQYRHPQL